MNPKAECVSVRKKRKWLTNEQKLEIIKLHEGGASYAEIGRNKHMEESSLRKLIKRKDQLKAQDKEYHLMNAITKIRSGRMVQMERLLYKWIEDLNQKGIPISQMDIRAKALSLYKDLQRNYTEDVADIFTASQGWFYRFKNRTGIQNFRFDGENETDVKYPQELKDLIGKGVYKDEEMVNVDETGFFWKKIPTRTYLAPNYCAGKELSFQDIDSNILLGRNVSTTREIDNDPLNDVNDQRDFDEMETYVDNAELVEISAEKVNNNRTNHRIINEAVLCHRDMNENNKYVQSSTDTNYFVSNDTTVTLSNPRERTNESEHDEFINSISARLKRFSGEDLNNAKAEIYAILHKIESKYIVNDQRKSTPISLISGSTNVEDVLLCIKKENTILDDVRNDNEFDNIEMQQMRAVDDINIEYEGVKEGDFQEPVEDCAVEESRENLNKDES
ncbi:PREDICTED: uncharacterized protein LOC108563967 [Nicrophorus vespilloides]|uniref:Uncharacterized protein LOC108563967 n=1 Tax=Nicrophorus vespilloides TaxID=110193 RepID=A0ABM1MUQ2_NICVS|nr:PREDICTED: uncharacterized protein LOC108563967 [Nicrophorus vespilloides]